MSMVMIVQVKNKFSLFEYRPVMPVDRSSPKATHATSEQRHIRLDGEFNDFSPSRLPVYDLHTPSGLPAASSSHTRKMSPAHIRRPRNAFFIFRSEFCEKHKMKENGIEGDHRHISRIAAHVWNSLSKDKKKIYKAKADMEKAVHKLAYPSYRYKPVYRVNHVKRKASGDSAKDELRCRQLANLLISGVKGKDFQQAAKALKEQPFDVDLVSQGVHKQSKLMEADKTERSATPSRALTQCSPSPGGDVSVSPRNSEINFQENSDVVTAAFPDCDDLMAHDVDPSLEQALHYLSTTDIHTYSGDPGRDLEQSLYLGPNFYTEVATPYPHEMPLPLPIPNNVQESLWLYAPSSESSYLAPWTVGLTTSNALTTPSSDSQHGSVGFSQYLPLLDQFSSETPWKPGADKDIFLAQAEVLPPCQPGEGYCEQAIITS